MVVQVWIMVAQVLIIVSQVWIIDCFFEVILACVVCM